MEILRRVAAVEAALGREDLEGARAALARLAELAPEHPQLGSLRGRLEEAAARVARRERLTGIAAAVRELLSRDDVEAAGRAVEEALVLDGEDAEARALRDRVQARRTEREGAQRAARERRVADAQARLAAGDLAGAVERFEAVLAEEPGHKAAARGLAEARTRRAADETTEAAAAARTALEARAAEGRLRLAEGDLVGAVEQFEGVLAEDAAHAEARRGLAEARERQATLQAQESAAGRQGALEARAAEGRLRLADGDLVGAIEQFEGVLAEDRDHAEARRGLAEARQRLETLEARVAAARRQAAHAARVASARLRLAAGDVVGAMERLEAVLAEERDHAEARRELAGARGRLEAIEGRVADSARQAAAEARMAQARARLAAGDLTGAIERFEAVLREDGAHQGAQQGLAAARERRAAREAQEQGAARRVILDARVAEARARLDAGDPGGAIERFEAVLREDGSHPAARRGLAEARTRRAAQEARDAEVATALSALETTLGEPDLEAVEAALAWLVDLAPEHPRLDALRDRIAQHRERVEEDREQTAREALAEAGRLLREEQLDRALESLARVRAIAPQHPDLPKLERQAQRIAAAREKQVGALLASAREALERDDLDAAQRAAQDALGIAARHPEALAVLERVQARTREVAQARRADALAAEAGRLLEEGKLDESEARVAELGELAPKHPQLASLRDRVRAHRSDPELLVRKVLEEAGRFIREGRPERVSEVLARLRALAPQHPQLAKLEAQAQKVLGARDVRVRVRGLVDQARKLHIRGDLEKALELAEEAVQLTPDDAWALRLRDDLVEQLQKTRRLQGKPPA